MDHLFKTTFAAQIRVLQPTKDDIQETQASLNDLRSLLPPDIVPEDDPDLLFIAANLAVAGVVNLNDDGLDISTALDIYKRFEKKQVNIEHNRDHIVGYILRSALSELETDRIITEDEAEESNKPFNIATVAVLWKIKAKELCNYLVEASNPLHPDYKSLSLSFEMGFNDYSVVSLPIDTIDISKATRTVTPVDKDYELYNTFLRANKGDGFDPKDKGNRLYRLMPQSVIPLGQGIVTYPAAAVKGIVAITHSPIPVVPDYAADTEEDVNKNQVASIQETRDILSAFCQVLEKKTSNDIIHLKIRVLKDIERFTKSMNNKDLEQIKTKISKADKLEDIKEAVAGLSPIVDAITTESERLVAQNQELQNQATKAAQAKEESLAAYEKLRGEFHIVKQQLEQVEASRVAAQAKEMFNERMAKIDEVFDLSDDDRAEIVADVKDLDEPGFDKWMIKAKKLMKEKTKSFKKDKADKDKQKNDEMCAALAAKGITVKFDESSLDFKEIIASAQNDVVSAPILNVVEPMLNLAEQAKAAFADSITFAGKKISEIKKK